ncbi:MAG: CvpA family protein [Bacteroidales bacterium]|nr:CvpA family protein [Bacteroidales bacterium]
MNYLDILLAIPLAFGIYRGFTKGFIVSVASLLALILGIYAAIHFSDFMAGYLENWFHPNPKYMPVLSFTVTLLFVVIIIRLLGWILDRFAKAIALGLVNRLLGVVFNLLFWGFILSVIISIMDNGIRGNSLISPETKEESLLYPPVSKIAPMVFPYLKFEELKERMDTMKIPLPKNLPSVTGEQGKKI